MNIISFLINNFNGEIMPSYNKCIFVGNVTRDPDIRSYNDTSIANFGIAINSNRGKEEQVLFLECSFFGKLAEICEKYVEKGIPILVEGFLVEDIWEDKKTKEEKRRIKLNGLQLQLLGYKKEEDKKSSKRR